MNFEKTFEKLTHTQDPTRIFDEFLDYAIDINLFTLKDQNLKFDGREEAYFMIILENSMNLSYNQNSRQVT